MLEDMASQSPAQRTDRLWQQLIWALVALLVLGAAHDADHLLDQDTLGELGVFFWALVAVQYSAFGLAIWLAVGRDWRTPGIAALLAGIVLAGFLAAHVLPFGLAPYSDTDPGAVSWALVFAPVAVAALCLAVAVRLIAADGVSSAALTWRRSPHPDS